MTIENSASRRTYEIHNCEYLGPVCSIRLPQKEKGILKEIIFYFE